MYKYLGFIIAFIAIVGLATFIYGLFYSIYDKKLILFRRSYLRTNNDAYVLIGFASFINKCTSVPILRNINLQFSRVLSIGLEKQLYIDIKASLLCILIILIGFVNTFIFSGIGQVWYVKAILIIISFYLPYYIATLITDLYIEQVNKKIPKVIDSFRSSFVKTRKIKESLRESGMSSNSNLNKALLEIAYKSDISEELGILGDRLKNVWFSMFVKLIQNYKTNGGELIDQLYRLNKTMILYINLEKKRSKKLIWYEVFAILSATLSIPVIFWLNYAILGSEGYIPTDSQGNMMIFRILCFTMFSLLVIRMLRRL